MVKFCKFTLLCNKINKSIMITAYILTANVAAYLITLNNLRILSNLDK